ncbi:MAG: hypothetical protein ACYS0I_19735 [Planctomycetota bacterium]|jgi:hypothetical protein
MKIVFSTRIKVVITVFVVVALQANVKQCWKGMELFKKFRGKDEITSYVSRFRGLKKVLPLCGVVGYIADDTLTAKGFSLTQYALLPVVVEQTTDHKLVIGNFRSPTINSAFYSEQKLELLNDFGNGVMLFKGRAN